MRCDAMFRIGLAAILTISLSGCATTGRPEPLVCALIGGGVGAVGGGVAGGLYAENNDERENNEAEGAGIAAASMVVGAGAGYLICSLMKEEKKPAPKQAPPPPPAPRAAPAPPPPPARPDPCKERVRLENVNFDNDKADIKFSSVTVLDETVMHLKGCPARRVRLTAYTDSNGSDAYNQKLSQRRADSVRSYLVSHGIDAGRIEAEGRGESNPIADNATPEGRAENRRVELEPIE
jgi:outer membrane protein OmpA-like peptidoglycan-associated protein